MKINLLPYKFYKETGSDVIGKVPTHWHKTIMKNIARLSAGKNRINTDLLSVYKDFGVIKKVPDGHPMHSEDLSKYKYVEKGDLVLNKMKMWQGSLGVSEYEGIVSPSYIVCKLDKQLNSQYINYLLRSSIMQNFYAKFSYGIREKQWDMHYGDFKNLKLYLPPREEQNAIAEFLNRKMDYVDKFIQIKNRQIELLKEQKSTVIKQAIFKGLHPYNELKPSGIDWICDIPAHWKVIRNKDIMRHRKGCVGENYDKYTLLSLTTSGIVKRDTENNKGKFPADFKTYQPVYIGDIIFCLFDIDKTSRTVGLADMDGMISGTYSVFDVHGINRKYLYYYYLYIDKKKHLSPICSGIRHVITPETFFKYKIVMPPENEQNEIVKYIEDKLSLINRTIPILSKEISVINQFRSQLISEAVTGKINVLNYYS